MATVARMAGFIRHLRLNGFPLGPRETETGLTVLETVGAIDPGTARLALRTTLCGRREEWDRFDTLFEAYWHARGRERARVSDRHASVAGSPAVETLWDHVLSADDRAGRAAPEVRSAGEDGDDAAGQGHQSLVATAQENLASTDLRRLVDPREIAAAEALALRLARSMRFHLSRRRRPDARGDRLDLRRIIRRSLAHGGEPLDLVRRRRPHRPVRLVLLLDVSGSMKLYSRFFLQFAKGLVGAWAEAEAFVFHTRLVKVSDAMRERDPIRAMDRLSLMAQGFGGGTRIGASLRAFNERHAASTLNSRSVVIILSDGYDTDEPDAVVTELARLRKRARRIVWLNPLISWRGYEPVARAMAAAMPLIDVFAPASTLNELAAVEGRLAKL